MQLFVWMLPAPTPSVFTHYALLVKNRVMKVNEFKDICH